MHMYFTCIFAGKLASTVVALSPTCKPTTPNSQGWVPTHCQVVLPFVGVRFAKAGIGMVALYSRSGTGSKR